MVQIFGRWQSPKFLVHNKNTKKILMAVSKSFAGEQTIPVFEGHRSDQGWSRAGTASPGRWILVLGQGVQCRLWPGWEHGGEDLPGSRLADDVQEGTFLPRWGTCQLNIRNSWIKIISFWYNTVNGVWQYKIMFVYLFNGGGGWGST